jgi:hypothetical protein
MLYFFKYISPKNLNENNKLSKKEKWLYNQRRLYSSNFNFCRDQWGLAKKTEYIVLDKKISAKKCRIASNEWTFRELLNYRFLKTSIDYYDRIWIPEILYCFFLQFH